MTLLPSAQVLGAGPKGLGHTGYQDPGQPCRAQLEGSFSHSSKVGRAPDQAGHRPGSVGLKEAREQHTCFMVTLAARSRPGQHHLGTFTCSESVESLKVRGWRDRNEQPGALMGGGGGWVVQQWGWRSRGS